ncbi:hypothetical protein KJK34_12835 [Flavobacterium sp. D11R37]|uniref:hypothetical protein n=1 Tax=Flavobacterium coralii TaxID=2838017 RepID=UPI001CA76468|nr:hypothetical protein [Flavobacterium coralii]MBY8963642.1 hypothetical protein [Flavobacterium coralii]
MKKIVFAVAAFAVMVIISCSSDDSSSNCAVCTFNQEGVNISESVCEGENGNAYLNDQDTTIDYEEYISSAEDSGYECN